VTTTLDVPVLIVGGGPVGLTTSILLSQLGVRSLLVERHRQPLLFPKGRGITVRSMEIFRQMGLEEAVQQVGLPREDSLHVYFGQTLTSTDFRRTPWGRRTEQGSALSPTDTFVCSQDRLEPVLRAQAETQQPGAVRFGTELTDLIQDSAGVTARLVERESGHNSTVRATYVVAADGAGSTVRNLLGIKMVGPSNLGHHVSIWFEAMLGPHVADRRSVLYHVANSDVSGIFLVVDNADRWLFTTTYDPAQGEQPEDFNDERCVAVVRRAAGLADLSVRVVGRSAWAPAAQVAERFQGGRTFLAGDAAHLTTPFGGFGMNCGLQDAHNLAWKLAATLGGWAGNDLLASYEVERRPVCQWTVDESLRNLEFAGEAATARTEEALQRHLSRRRDAGLVLGFAYSSAVIVPDGVPPLAVAAPYAEFVPTARPGHRAPHLWLERQGQALSTLDLFGCELVLLAGYRGEAWCEAASKLGSKMAVPLEAYQVGGEGLMCPSGAWQAVYGIDDDGAVLVRPDGHVAWRSRAGSADAEGQLRQVLCRVLGHG
jgi:2-polyprenyl-6-methoxyphenol hydroxylase-like FAD-dependent oxidoreductase